MKNMRKIKQLEKELAMAKKNIDRLEKDIDGFLKDNITILREKDILEKALELACKNNAITWCYDGCIEYSDNNCEGGICVKYRNEVKRCRALFINQAKNNK